MRVHSLEMTAFGPFSEHEVVDFDSLSDAGIFLLTGKTGAGKTSILDAICFGLYGAVPGPRNGARDLKSHYSAPDARPLVELEVTIRGRRLRLSRSPGWSRPSRRARHGAVEVHARASAMELVDGAWVPLSTRLDEVGQLISRLLGMSKDQFCQVVMLPQGQFQSFLRAGAKERHDVLESLFETGRFQRIESWLNDCRRAADAACAAKVQSFQQLLSRIDEANGVPLADESVDLLTATSSTSALKDIRARLTVAIEQLQTSVANTRVAVEAASVASKTADHTVDEGRLTVARQAEYAAALRRVDELDATESVADGRRAAITGARAAARLSPVVDQRDEALAQLAALGDESAHLRAALTSADLEPTPDLTTTLDSMRTRRATLAALAEVETELAARAAHEETLAGRLVAHDVKLAELEEALRGLPDQLAAAHEQLTIAMAAAGLAGSLRTQVSESEQAASAATTAELLAATLATLTVAETDAREGHQTAKQRWLDLRERYLDNIAASLAGELVDGAACPVCGSCEHPLPAQGAIDAVSPADERTAHELSERADADLTAATLAANAARDRHTAAQVAAGSRSRAEWDAQLAALRPALDEAERAADDVTNLSTAIQALDNARGRLSDERIELTSARSADATQLDASRTASSEQRAQLAHVLGDAPDVATALAEVDAVVEVLDRLLLNERDSVRVNATVTAVSDRVAAALAQSQFATIDEVRAAAMTEQDIAAEDALLRQRDTERAVALKVLDSPAHVAANDTAPPDLIALVAEADGARVAYSIGESALRRETERHGRLDALATSFDELLSDWQPLLEARDLAASVAAMCAGTAADNKTKTKLSHYVLSARLAQVVSAANTRLAGICGGRYQLMHSMERGVSDSRGGLGLRVLDNHTGQRRDPATLSGGETFYVSLALALGLADLVRDEIGGVELSTLFVDEGFGSLDAETLDEVLDEIDSLRSGGRCVGLVSHLPELRSRIPTQLRVTGHRDGSTISAL